MNSLKNLEEVGYIDILNALKESVDGDNTMPKPIKTKANNLMQDLFELLWDYSA